jgi:2-keto-4-pentenoate hydratase
MDRKHELVSIAAVGRTSPTTGPAGRYVAVIDSGQVADSLIAAEREREPIAPFSDTYLFFAVDGAYQVRLQARWLRHPDHQHHHGLREGDRLSGGSLGFSSARP